MKHMMNPQGRIHSIQTLGTLDGPGVRFVAFLQGCPLRCGCCHNPDTWEYAGGELYTPTALLEKAKRYRTYFGDHGGVTLSGGEPLLQAEFCTAFFAACREEHINTCLDTSGCFLTDAVQKALDVTDHVLLDIKYATDADYREYVGCSIDAPLAFLRVLNEKHIPTTLRTVIIPTLNDNAKMISFLKQLKESHPCVEKIELLPFKKICTVKYENMGIPFRFAHIDIPTKEKMAELQSKCYKNE